MTSYIIYIIISFLISAACTGVLIPIIIAFCRKYNFYDQPDHRKVHQKAIPRLGGLAFLPTMALGTTVTTLIYYNQTQSLPQFTYSAVLMILGSVVIYLIGLLDDLLNLPAITKFFFMLCCSILLPFCSLMINNVHGLFGFYELSLWVGFPITVLVILTIVNSLNLIDGIDGLASGIACVCLIVFILIFQDLHSIFFMTISSALLGSVLVFFCFNVFGRERGYKIFMGDAGSLILGYILSYLAIKTILICDKDIYFIGNPLLVPYSLFIVPVFDLVRVFFTRLLNGQSVFVADKRHIHHVLMSSGLSMRASLATILLLMLFFLLVNLGLGSVGIGLTSIFFINIAIFAAFFLILRAIRQHKSGS